MKGLAFPESTVDLGRSGSMSEEECGSLPVYQHPNEPVTISCWKMTWRERFSAIIFGKVWVWVYSGGKTQPPLSLMVLRTIFERENDGNRKE